MSLEDRFDEVRQLIIIGKEKGYLLYDEVNDLLPADLTSSPEDLDELMSMFGAAGIDLVVMDLRLPGGGGLELVRSVRRTAGGKDVPLNMHMLTGYMSADLFLSIAEKAGRDLTVAHFQTAAGDFSDTGTLVGDRKLPQGQKDSFGCGALVQLRNGTYEVKRPSARRSAHHCWVLTSSSMASSWPISSRVFRASRAASCIVASLPPSNRTTHLHQAV